MPIGPGSRIQVLNTEAADSPSPTLRRAPRRRLPTELTAEELADAEVAEWEATGELWRVRSFGSTLRAAMLAFCSRVFLLLIALVLIAVACSSQRSEVDSRRHVDGEEASQVNGAEDAPTFGDAGALDDPEASSCAPGSCPEGLYCYGSSACDSVWTCQPDPPSCSAAAPLVACGCDGVFTHVAAGCPARHAWSTNLASAYAGSPCEVERRVEQDDLGSLDLVYLGRGLESFEGTTIRVRILALMNPPPNLEEEAAVVQGGAFEFTWVGLGEAYYSYFNALTLFDSDEDGDCDSQETILIARIPNPYDLAITTASLTLTPDNIEEFSSHCDWWNE